MFDGIPISLHRRRGPGPIARVLVWVRDVWNRAADHRHERRCDRERAEFKRFRRRLDTLANKAIAGDKRSGWLLGTLQSLEYEKHRAIDAAVNRLRNNYRGAGR